MSSIVLDLVINKLNSNNNNLFLLDTSDNSKMYLDHGAIQLLKAYYISKEKQYG